MVLGPSLDTLAGTLKPMPMCAFWAHVVMQPSKYFAWDDAKKRSSGRSVASASRTSCSTSNAVICSTSWSTRTPTGTRASASSSSGAATYLVTFVEDEHPVFLKTIIPKAEGHEAVLRGGARR
jgi:hypothetical protein